MQQSNNLQKTKLVCINYPGNVENVDKALETLGGKDVIEQAVGTPLKRLEVKFRPRNKMAKAAIADKDTKPVILLKVKVPVDNDQNSVDREQSTSQKTDIENKQKELNGGLDYEVVGITALSFKFNRMCDFQFLPLASKDKIETEESKVDYIHDRIIPEELPDLEWFKKDETKSTPTLLTPALFSRSDTVNRLHFPRTKFYEKRFNAEIVKKIKSASTSETINTSKYISVPRRNKSYCKSVTIKEKEIPAEPYKSSLLTLTSKYVSESEYEKIKQLFQERPIWSRAACQNLIGVGSIHIRALLSLVGYYFLTGPWRIMWVRYGYDPRKDPESRKYQTFDFRIRTSGGLKLGVQAKRNYTRGETQTKKITLNEDVIIKHKRGEFDDSDYILRPNMIPPARQMFYQYCDVEIPEIQAMLTRLPPVAPGTKCDDKNGWLPSSFTDQCREIANRYITKHVQALLDEEKSKSTKENESGKADDVGKSDETGEFELLEISDSDEDNSGDEQIVINAEGDSEDDDDDDEFVEGNLSGIKPKDEDDEIDLDAVKEINKLLGVDVDDDC